MCAAKKTKKTVKKTTAKKTTKKSSKKPVAKASKKLVKKVKKAKVVAPPVLETFVKQDAVEASVDANGVVTMVPVKS